MTDQSIATSLGFVRREFSIPDWVDLQAGGGIPRLIGATALISSQLRRFLESIGDESQSIALDFKDNPQINISVIGSIITERPLAGSLAEADFRRTWRYNGITAAVKTAMINPVYRAHIHLVVRIGVEYCRIHGIICQSAVTKKHAEHLRPLRYFFHEI
jgi:hypothetical protein